MKTLILSIIGLMTFNFALAQSDVYLNINHKLGATTVTSSPNGSNNIGNDFYLGRMQYYLSNFILVHDNGQETPLVDLYALVDGKQSTEIFLGSINFTEIEAIKFSVGVDASRNHLDPATYAASDPLAPQNPSMHWGWSSGYRFVAMEGTAGPTSQTFEIHALGDNLYFETSVIVEGQEQNGNVYINIDGDYAEAIRDINVSSGVIQHGSTNEAADLLENFQTNVFKASALDTVANPTGIKDLKNALLISTFPNPSSGEFHFSLDNVEGAKSLELYNTLGMLIQSHAITESNFTIFQKEIGVYLALIKDDNGFVLGQSRLIVK